VEAERKKRAAILESEGIRQSEINKAEGDKQSRILRSEAQMLEHINIAQGEAKAIELQAEARRQALDKVARALNGQGGPNAASLTVAEKYVEALSKLAKENNTLIITSNVADVSGVVAQAMAVYSKISSANAKMEVEHKKTGDH